MLRQTRTALKYLALGLAIGLLVAPRSGAETRRLLLGRVWQTVEERWQQMRSASAS